MSRFINSCCFQIRALAVIIQSKPFNLYIRSSSLADYIRYSKNHPVYLLCQMIRILFCIPSLIEEQDTVLQLPSLLYRGLGYYPVYLLYSRTRILSCIPSLLEDQDTILYISSLLEDQDTILYISSLLDDQDTILYISSLLEDQDTILYISSILEDQDTILYSVYAFSNIGLVLNKFFNRGVEYYPNFIPSLLCRRLDCYSYVLKLQ